MTRYEQNFLNLAINTRKTLSYLSKVNEIVLKLEIAKIKKLKIICTNGEI